jgi:hypothetical protein
VLLLYQLPGIRSLAAERKHCPIDYLNSLPIVFQSNDLKKETYGSKERVTY